MDRIENVVSNCWRKQAEVFQNHLSTNVLATGQGENTHTRYRGLSLALVRPTTFQVGNCRLGVVKQVKALSSTEACTDRFFVYILQKYYSLEENDSVYGAHKLRMLLTGRGVMSLTLMRNYDATNAAPTQKHKPHLQTNKQSWNQQKFGLDKHTDSKVISYVSFYFTNIRKVY
jgi:hypothetical protein